jgi:hypothetical protein
LPDQDVVIAVTAETADMQAEINLIWEYLLPAIKTDNLPENTALSVILKQKLSSLALPLPVTGSGSVVVSQISGKTFAFNSNDKHLETMNFHFKDSICNLSMRIDSILYNFTLGSGYWITGETTLLGPNLLLLAKAHFVGLPPARIAGSFGWKDENTLEMVLRYIESPHSETITCKFDKNKVSVVFHYSNTPTSIQPELKGVVLAQSPVIMK